MRAILGFGCVVLVTGCEDVASSNIATDGLWADIEAVADGSGASETHAVLRVGGVLSTTFVSLDGQDVLEATLDGDTRDMSRESLGDAHRYVAQFDTAPIDVPYTIAFVRPDGEGAPDTTVTLPDAFDLDPVPDTFSRLDEDLVLSWSPPADELVRIDASGDCIWPFRKDLDGDGGTFTLTRGTLVPLDEDEPIACEIAVSVSRMRQGTLDPAYGEGGTAYGIQRRTVDVSSTP